MRRQVHLDCPNAGESELVSSRMQSGMMTVCEAMTMYSCHRRAETPSNMQICFQWWRETNPPLVEPPVSTLGETRTALKIPTRLWPSRGYAFSEEDGVVYRALYRGEEVNECNGLAVRSNSVVGLTGVPHQETGLGNGRSAGGPCATSCA